MHAIFAREKTTQGAYTIRQGRNDYRAMRNAFIAWYGNFDIDSRRRLIRNSIGKFEIFPEANASSARDDQHRI